MKKIMIMVLCAILAGNISAQETKSRKAEKKSVKQEQRLSKEECEARKQERIERDIKFLSDELYLSAEQEAQFAETYRALLADQAKLFKQYEAEFGKFLNERQTKKVLHFCAGKHPHGNQPPKQDHPKAKKPQETPRQ